MALRGERFSVDLSSTDGDRDASCGNHSTSGLSLSALGFLGDIHERIPSSSPTNPPAPRSNNSVTGFPAHRKRERHSAFKKQRIQSSKGSSNQSRMTTGLESTSSSAASAPLPRHEGAAEEVQQAKAYNEVERSQIDKENRLRIAAMSTEEIERERHEVMNSLSPSLIEQLLKRASIDEGKETTNFRADPGMDSRPEQFRKPRKSVNSDAPRPNLGDEDRGAAPSSLPTDLNPASFQEHDILDSSTMPLPTLVHFPRHPDPPDLEPNDPLFLSNLHEKYFPTLSVDPAKLAWMAPIPDPLSVADNESPYSPSQESLPASAIRFDFRGALIPPRTAREIPVTKGLHHHGEAPEAAGYTLPELARLARSTFPAQRSVAFQTLGRVLYRLGKGVYGDEGSELPMGLWRCIEEGKILETLQEEVSKEGGHISAKAYATEAVWNWQKGGGRRWKAG
ncbi:MAG: hypothetical protein M1835_000585 [Candelina submexicana]|nr:MAG: hypothetical protein M1835_000585 [Candelina submexicana]